MFGDKESFGRPIHFGHLERDSFENLFKRKIYQSLREKERERKKERDNSFEMLFDVCIL